MDEQRARLHEDLQGFFEGDLEFEPLRRAPYGADAGLWEVDPLGVASPRSEADLAALVRYAAERNIPLHPRGAGAGRTGGAIGPGLVVDMSRYFRRVVEVGPSHVVVQAGVVLGRLNDLLAASGRRIGPDPEGAQSHTIGGLVSLDACGPRSLASGTMSKQIERIRVVFANGEAGELAQVERPAIDAPADRFADAVARRLDVLLAWNAERLSSGVSTGAGYAIEEVACPDGRLDLARLISGAEGTLAIITEARLRTLPFAHAQAVVVLPFPRLLDAAEAVPGCLAERPSACELFDRRGLSVARDLSPFYRDAVSEHAEAALIVEFEGDDLSSTIDQARKLGRRLDRAGALIDLPNEFEAREDCDRLVHLGRAISPVLARARAASRPLDLVDRLRIAPERLAGFIAALQALMMHERVGWTLDARAGVAEVRVRPYFDLTNQTDRERIGPLSVTLRKLAQEMGGTVCPGLGSDRLAAIRRQQGDLFNAHRELKFSFDPLNLLNPGKFVGDDAKPIPASLRATTTSESAGDTTAADGSISGLRWPDRSRDEHRNACNNCGACRTEEPTLRMCPTFRATHMEAASPRSKVQVLRQIAAGRVDPKLWGSEELKAHADLCIHCNLCEPECPAGVDVSALMIEAKAAYVANHGLPPDDWFLSRIDVWSGLASRFSRVFNILSRNRAARWLMERMFGLSRYRTLPRARRASFLRRAERLGLTRPKPQEPGPRAAYFVDIAANYFDEDLAETVVGLLRHAGVNVYVPKPQKGSGMPALVAGDIERARELLEANLRVLGSAARDGYTIVCSEPTAALVLRREALRLTDNLDAGLVAANTMDAGRYLVGLLTRGDLPRPNVSVPIRVGYHQPCHLRALGDGNPGLELLRTVPGLEVEYIDRGCSGMAGTFGLAARNVRTSLRAGRGLLRRLRDDVFDGGATECFACRLQMEQLTSKRTLHPLKLLALGYGLDPGLRRELDRSLGTRKPR